MGPGKRSIALRTPRLSASGARVACTDTGQSADTSAGTCGYPRVASLTSHAKPLAFLAAPERGTPRLGVLPPWPSPGGPRGSPPRPTPSSQCCDSALCSSRARCERYYEPLLTDDARLFAHLSLPALRALHVRLPRASPTPRSTPSSRRRARMSASTSLATLASMPALQELRIAGEPLDAALRARDLAFLAHLTPSAAAPVRCPRLRSVEFLGFLGVSDETVLRFIRARTDPIAHVSRASRLRAGSSWICSITSRLRRRIRLWRGRNDADGGGALYYERVAAGSLTFI
ncbi:hypothetical protein B0H17DRAFT_1151587 [Mycena rosella]|uniref:Uncharacterized protein n=1 Tax=Mycena rosella TaxID=1033263 RepID=A0AAD7BJA4_MYCRO|nr:hypothetical protein B0H17DRAFT_1151587 [Mycena rosella]